MDAYRDKARDYGYEARPDQLGWLVPIYVADTDEQARDEARPHIEAFANKFLRNPPEMLLPPGYTSIASLKNVRKHKSSLSKAQTVESLIEDEVVVIGSPDTVREKLVDCQRRVALGNVLALLPVRHLARRPDEEEHGDVRGRGDADACRRPYRAAGACRGRIAHPQAAAGPR